MSDFLNVVAEDRDLLVINKPAGLVCHPTKTDERSSLVGRVRLYLGKGAAAHLINRLDRETGGLVIVAKNDEAARELRRLWEGRKVEKEYLAIVHGQVREDRGRIEAPLGKDETSRVAVKDCVRADGLPSQTEFQIIRRFTRPSDLRPELSTFNSSASAQSSSATAPKRSEGGQPSTNFTLLRVHPLTGRKHQIRIHLAHIGHPIVGDKIYGGDEDLYLALVENRLTDEQRARLILPNQALHAAAVRFVWRGRPMEFRAEPESWFQEFVNHK